MKHISEVILPTVTDLATVETMLRSGTALDNERFESDHYLDDVVEKPWGLEYRVYADSFYDIWKLSIRPDGRTSLHCHPRKDTALLCLGGKGEITLLNSRKLKVAAGTYVTIKRGAFHSTQNVGDGDLDLIEVEMPRNKFDLLRVSDQYGRTGQTYEKARPLPFTPTAMQRSEQGHAVKYRTNCVYQRYRFAVVPAQSVAPENLMFSVPLGMQRSIDNRIAVFSGLPKHTESKTEPCFCIYRD